MNHGPWATVAERRPAASVRLVCFPYAGGGAAAFRDWHRHLPAQIEVVAVQLPGRENRYGEPLHTSLTGVIAPLVQTVQRLADKPFLFFGHSMGALIAFELARALCRAGAAQPFHLAVSGMRAPHLPRTEEPLHRMPDDELFDKIAAYNGTPQDLLADRDLMRFFLPQLRADFSIVETYAYAPAPRLPCPLTALGGTRDPNVAPDELVEWAGHTTGPFRHHLFDGDHFYLQPCKSALLDLLASLALGGATAMPGTSAATGMPAHPARPAGVSG
jgi:medium-chain acyl-[acyl-carrier-protein] hydrolase